MILRNRTSGRRAMNSKIAVIQAGIRQGEQLSSAEEIVILQMRRRHLEKEIVQIC